MADVHGQGFAWVFVLADVMKSVARIFGRVLRDWRCDSLRATVFLWFVNATPDLYICKILKGVFLKAAGVQTGVDHLYCRSPIQIDRPSSVLIGQGVFINRNVYFEGEGRISIGKNCHIGPNVVFATTNHNITESMMPVIGDIVVGDNVWVGANSVLLSNIELGPNIVVAAGSIVNKSFNNCVIAGAPAHVVRAFFDKEERPSSQNISSEVPREA